jgi:hypothetical protein
MRVAKSLTLDEEINEYILATKGTRSAGERFNELLRRAMLAEQYERLEVEASAFFAHTARDQSETKNFQTAAVRTLIQGRFLASNHESSAKLVSGEIDAGIAAGARSSLSARLESQSTAKGAKGRRRWTRDKLYEDK